MIVVTGALGFIGSALLGELQRLGYGDLVAVDNFQDTKKYPNLESKQIQHRIERSEFLQWFEKNGNEVQFVFHIGARTKTNEFDWDVLNELNVNYSKKLWTLCTQFNIPFIYASSAATYGNGSNGFSDNIDMISSLKPLNPYGESKQLFDLWVLSQDKTPPFWAGFKFFNVFGPNEYHKDRMASVIFHAFHQIRDTNQMALFKSYRSDFEDGEQKRDFVYIKDVLSVLIHFMENRRNSGIYNLGTGQAHTFLELAHAVFKALDLEPKINFVDMPEDIRDNYQYFTQAEMSKIRNAGYNKSFTEFELAVNDYVCNYLQTNQYL